MPPEHSAPQPSEISDKADPHSALMLEKVPDDFYSKWQNMLDSLAELTGADSSTLSTTNHHLRRILLTNRSKTNPFSAGESFPINNTTCSGALTGNIDELSVENLAHDLRWNSSAGADKNMSSFYGVPIIQEQIGVIGVLGIYATREKAFNPQHKKTVQLFQQCIQDDLNLKRSLVKLQENQSKILASTQYLEEQNNLKSKELRELSEQYATDVAQLKDTQKALKKSKTDFSSLVQNIPGIVYHCALDDDWTMHLISDDVEYITGFPASDFIQNKVRTYASVIHLDDRDYVDQTVHEGIRDKKTYQIEYRVVHKDGTVRWVYEQGKGILGKSGEVLWLDGVVLDITDKKLAEQALRKSERRGNLLKEVAVAANAAPKISEVFIEALDSVCSYTGWPVGHVFMPNGDRTELTSTGLWHLDDEQKFEPLKEATENGHFPLGMGLPGKAWQTAAPYWSEDVANDPAFLRAHIDGGLCVSSALAIPILSKGQVVAVLEFFSTSHQQRDKELLAVMDKIGQQLGIVLERKRAELSLLEYQDQLEQMVKIRTHELEESNHKLINSLDVLRHQEQMMNHDLKMAKELQNRFLPAEYPFPGQLRFAGYYDACSSVGGDLFDVFKIDEQCVGFYMADVAGHGVSAAMVTAVLKVTIDNFSDYLEGAILPDRPLSEQVNYKEFIHKLNHETHSITDSDQFVTLQLGVLHIETGHLMIVNAGHNTPLVWNKASASCHSVATPANVPVGLLSQFDFQAIDIRLHRGDKLIIYTDGLTERHNTHGEEFGDQRLIQAIQKMGQETPQELLDYTMEANRTFAGEASAEDDVALLITEYKPRILSPTATH